MPMRKTAAAVLALLLLFTTACSSPAADPDETPPVDGAGIRQAPDEQVAAQAYLDKCEELEASYGRAELVDSGFDGYSVASYLSGLCLVELFDFDGDGLNDLFVVYMNGQISGKNASGDAVFAQASSYEVEVWTYSNGSLEQLLHLDRISEYSSFASFDFDSDECFIMVYQGREGQPVIQLYSDDGGGCTYTNYYYANGQLVKENYSYYDNTFIKDGEEVDEGDWEAGTSSFDVVLLGAFLASSSAVSNYLEEFGGVSYDSSLACTQNALDNLESGRLNGRNTVESDLLAPYLLALDRANRAYQDQARAGKLYAPYRYSLYDIDHNGWPELIIELGSGEADRIYETYKGDSGEPLPWWSFTANHSSLYGDGVGWLVIYTVDGESYSVFEAVFDGGEGEAERLVASGTAAASQGESYPTLDELGFAGYSVLPFGHAPSPVALINGLVY